MKTATNQSMLGQLLKTSGRIDEQDIERALEYQREHGGYFGEALVALKLVSREELDWTLASQFDIPYVFPDPDTVDRSAAALVSAEWALSNLTLPILRLEDTLNVIVHTPLWNEAVEELQQRSGLRIELALASAAKIRELIRHVYPEGQSTSASTPASPVTVGQFLALAADRESPRFGLSASPGGSVAWYEDRGSIERHPLMPNWQRELEALISPSPSQAIDGQRMGDFEAKVTINGGSRPVQVRFMASSGDPYELVIEPRPSGESDPVEVTPPPPAVLSEVRLLAGSGAARFLVSVSPQDLGARIIHRLPELLLGHETRAVGVKSDERSPNDDVFVHEVPVQEQERTRMFEELRSFYFDAVTADMAGNPDGWLTQVLDVAPAAFLLWTGETDEELAYAAGVRWCLRVEETAGDHLEWSLRPIEL